MLFILVILGAFFYGVRPPTVVTRESVPASGAAVWLAIVVLLLLLVFGDLGFVGERLFL
jgi:hypothetical protein